MNNGPEEMLPQVKPQPAVGADAHCPRHWEAQGPRVRAGRESERERVCEHRC